MEHSEAQAEFSQNYKTLVFTGVRSPREGLGALTAQNEKHEETRNTRETVVQSVQRLAGQIKAVDWACQTLFLQGNTSSTTPPHWGEDWVRRAGCEGKIGEIVLSALPWGLGYFFLFFSPHFSHH